MNLFLRKQNSFEFKIDSFSKLNSTKNLNLRQKEKREEKTLSIKNEEAEYSSKMSGITWQD